MRILVFDTETSGLPHKEFFNKVSLTTINMWPYIVQLSYVVYDTKINDIDDFADDIIKIPKHVKLDGDSEKIHGITNIMCENHGISILNALVDFNNIYNDVDIIVGHNIDFDINMLQAEWYRIISQSTTNYEIRQEYDRFCQLRRNKKQYCTLKENVKMCNIQAISKKTGKPYVKWPTLDELHQHLFKSSAQNLHNAIIDVMVCLRCFYKIHADIDLLESCYTMSETIGNSLINIK